METSRIRIAETGDQLIAILLVVSITGVILATVATIVMTRNNVVKPLKNITKIMARISEGDLTQGIPYLDKSNELGLMARTLEVFKSNIQQNREMNDAQIQSAERNKKRNNVLIQLSSSFKSKIGDSLNTLETVSEDMSNTSQTTSEISDKVYSNSETARHSVDEVSQNASAVAKAADELNKSVQAVGFDVRESSSMTRETVAKTQDAR